MSEFVSTQQNSFVFPKECFIVGSCQQQQNQEKPFQFQTTHRFYDSSSISTSKVHPVIMNLRPLQQLVQTETDTVVEHSLLQLLEKGFLVDCVDDEFHDCDTPLHVAVKSGSSVATKILIEAGAKVNAFNSKGQTPLWIASQISSLLLVNLLLHFGANPNLHDLEGQSPLHIACATASFDVIDTLIVNGGFIHASDNEGDKPLHWAIREGRNVEVIRNLLKRDATIAFDLNLDGESPLDFAKEFEAWEIVNILQPSEESPSKIQTTTNRSLLIPGPGKTSPPQIKSEKIQKGGTFTFDLPRIPTFVQN